MFGANLISLIATLVLTASPSAEAQQPKVYRIGALVPGSAWYEIIDGLRLGLRSWGLKKENNIRCKPKIGKAMPRPVRRLRKILTKKKSI